MIKCGILEAIWEEFVNQQKDKGYDVKKGVIQDATFITSDPGHAKSDVLRGKEAKLDEVRTANGPEGKQIIFRMQGAHKTDTENTFIWKVETTVANTHDSKVDLANGCEVRYGDKGYHGAKTNGYDASNEKSI